MDTVEIHDKLAKRLTRVPKHVAVKLKAWVYAVEIYGLEFASRSPGFHDEPLRGARAGQRSIRLTRSYRAFYRIERRGLHRHVFVFEVNKHDY